MGDITDKLRKKLENKRIGEIPIFSSMCQNL